MTLFQVHWGLLCIYLEKTLTLQLLSVFCLYSSINHLISWCNHVTCLKSFNVIQSRSHSDVNYFGTSTFLLSSIQYRRENVVTKLQFHGRFQRANMVTTLLVLGSLSFVFFFNVESFEQILFFLFLLIEVAKPNFFFRSTLVSHVLRH